MGPAPKIKNNETSCPTSSRVMMVLIIICPSFWSKIKMFRNLFSFEVNPCETRKTTTIKTCQMTNKRQKFLCWEFKFVSGISSNNEAKFNILA